MGRLVDWLRDLGEKLRPGPPVDPTQEPSGDPVVEGFRMGPLRSGYVSVDGDGSRVIEEKHVHVAVDPEFVVLPPELMERRRDREDRATNGGYWNGSRYAVVSCRPGRTGDREEPELWIALKHSDYLNFLTTQQLDQPFDDGSTPRSNYLAGRPIPDMPDFMANSFGAHIAVVTADDRLVVSKRSAKVAVQADMWSASVSEGLSRGMDGANDAAPDIYDLARRGMEEELTVSKGEYRLELLSVGLATTVHQWVSLFVAHLDVLTWDELAARLSRGSGDPWEHSAREVVEFAPGPVLSLLLRPDRVANWTPAAPPAFYYALVRRFGRAQVDQELERLLRAG